jgi:hypothetical protein
MAAISEDTTLGLQAYARRVLDIVEHIGESEEVDSMNKDEVSGVLDTIGNGIIETYNLEDDAVLNQFVEYDQTEANAYVTEHPLDVSVHRDLVIAVYQLESLINLNFVNYIDVNEKKSKYLRTLERLESFYKGISNPYQYFSKFFLRLLEEQCSSTEALELFLSAKFECRLLDHPTSK